MTRPTILDLDLVVVPREATFDIADAFMLLFNGSDGGPSTFEAWDAMLSASPYPTAWDDVRKYVEGLERERNESIARETDAWRRANRAESRVKAWEGFVVVRDLPRLAVPTKDFGPGEQDTVSVPKITPEKLTEIIDRAEAAEARIAELEKRLADAESHRVLADPCVKKLEDGEPFFVLLGRDADASQALADWISRRLRSEGKTEKVKAAENTLDAFRDFQDLRAARAYMEGK